MKVTVVYGTERKGCTYNIAQLLLGSLAPESLEEVFLPRDLPQFCTSCMICFLQEPGRCPHARYTMPIRAKLVEADIIVLTSPVYSFHLTGQMKTMLDHYANMWLVHRPEPAMFRKQGVVIATASGPVFSATLKELKDSLDFWGVSRTFSIGSAVFQTDWDKASEKIKKKLEKKTASVASRLKKGIGKEKPSFRVRKWFHISRMMQKFLQANPVDAHYWREQGWLGGKRPWKIPASHIATISGNALQSSPD